MWPTVRHGIDVVLGLQAPGGQVWWARDTDGSVRREALLTGNASIHLSLRCAIGLAEVVGEAVPELELAADGVRHSLDEHPERYADKSRYSMDWYYPVLGGALPAPVARAHLDAHRDEFVVPGLGIRCVSDRPWVTGAETCEYVLALDAAGQSGEAREQFAAMQHLRDPDGSYWTGYVYPDRARWPVERSTWTAATVVLAADALSRTTGGNGLFRGEGLPTGTMRPTLEGICSCPTSH
jgi:MMP endo-(1,4)-3-O-methyl-alpha-D-mannosidase